MQSIAFIATTGALVSNGGKALLDWNSAGRYAINASSVKFCVGVIQFIVKEILSLVLPHFHVLNIYFKCNSTQKSLENQKIDKSDKGFENIQQKQSNQLNANQLQSNGKSESGLRTWEKMDWSSQNG